MEESYFEPGEGVHGPMEVEHNSTASGRRYGSWLQWQNDQPKREPDPPQRQQPTLQDHFNWMIEAREQYKAAMAGKEIRLEKLAENQEALQVLEQQQRELEERKTEVFLSGDRERITDLSQDIAVNQHQIALKKAEITALFNGEDIKALLQEAREAERNFYAQVLDDYKKQVTNGSCNMPFSELLTRAYALGSRVGVGRVRDFLFQWVGEPSLAESYVQSVIQEVEAEYEK